MKTTYDKKSKVNMLTPETPLEAINILEEFLECDLWYAFHNEFKKEQDMSRYLKKTF